MLGSKEVAMKVALMTNLPDPLEFQYSKSTRPLFLDAEQKVWSSTEII